MEAIDLAVNLVVAVVFLCTGHAAGWSRRGDLERRRRATEDFRKHYGHRTNESPKN